MIASLNEEADFRIIYIAGYGRSGSTLLDMALSSCDQIESVGAGSTLSLWIRKNDICSCGERFNHCAFWGQILKNLLLSNDKSLKWKINFFSYFESILLPVIWPGLILISNEYRLVWQSIFKSMRRESGARWIVDSSKTTFDSIFRPVLLRGLVGSQIEILHLQRSTKAVVNSAMKGPGSPERVTRIVFPQKLHILKVLLHLVSTDFLTRMLYGWLPEYRVIKYEELSVNAIDKIVGKITKSRVHETHTPYQAKHNLGGNRLRFNLVSSINIKEGNFVQTSNTLDLLCFLADKIRGFERI